jgi:ATP-binding cassette subfamily B protein
MEIITLGIIVAFLSLAKSIASSVGQVSSQVGMIAMGLAGASRIFKILDEESEKDEGYVTLVNVEINNIGTFIESK